VQHMKSQAIAIGLLLLGLNIFCADYVIAEEENKAGGLSQLEFDTQEKPVKPAKPQTKPRVKVTEEEEIFRERIAKSKTKPDNKLAPVQDELDRLEKGHGEKSEAHEENKIKVLNTEDLLRENEAAESPSPAQPGAAAK
jgi:hypothetical protein